jgi:predicted nucleotidyltransferase
LENLLKKFHEQDVRYALIGGFALGMYGISRATVDLDFLVHRDDIEKVDEIMRENGYECGYRTDNVSQYFSPLKVFGQVDFIHAYREISVGMLQRAEDKKVFNESISVKVLKVEDIIGFKVQAIANDESRKQGDLADIEALMDLHEKSLDWDSVKNYFSLFGFSLLFDELKRKHPYDK